MRIKIIKKNIKHLNDKIIDATGDRFVDVSVSSGDRLVIEAQGQTTVITANANQLAQGAIENSQGLQFKRLNFDLLVGNGETTYVRISRFYLMSDVQLESVSWNGQLLNDTFVGQLNTWQYGSMVAESPISVSDPGAFVGVSNVSDTVAMGSATTTQVASVGGFSPIGWVASVPATAAGAGISMTGAAVVGGGALLASAAAKGKSSDSSSSTPDTASPTFVSATTSTDGKKIILTYDENLLTTTTNQAATNAFTVLVGGAKQTVSSVASSGNTVTLNLSSAITNGQTVTVAYADPTTGDDANAVQDLGGNDAASLAPTAVTNNVPDSSDTTPPTITSFTSNTTDGSYKAGSSIDIRATASEALQSGAQITVTLDTGEAVTLTRDTSTANLLVGSYTVGIGKSSADLNVSSYILGTGLATPKDIAGNAMTSTTVPANNNIAGSKNIVVDTTAPAALDLVSGTVGTQATESQYYAATNAGSGKAIAPNVALSTDTDVAKITVTVGGTADTTNDALVFGTVTQTLNTTAAPGGTNVTINGVTGVDWSYSAGKVLTLSKTGGGAFTAAQVQLIEQGLQFKTTSGATQGDRTFAIAHQDTAGNTGTAGTETVTVDTMAPAALDLVSGTVGTQATESQYYAATNAGSGKAIAPNVALSTDTDVAKITVTVGGTADTTNDALVFGTVTQTLNTTAAPGGTNVTINGVTGVDWSYSAGKVLTLSKTGGGAFTAAQVQLIEQGLQFKTTSGATQGNRTFAIAHQDTAGNTGTAGTETVTVDTMAPAALDLVSGTVGTQATESQYYAATNAGSGKAIAPNVAQSTDTDVAKITVTVGGTADTTNDALVFGTVTQTLNTTAAPGGTNVTINGVTGVDWSYSAGKVLTLSKTGGGAFTAAQVQLIEQGLQFKTTSGATQGNRTFAIAHQDTAGNTGTAGTETVTVDTTAPAFTSGLSASTPINTATTTVVYDANATDAGNAADAGITYTLSDTDAALFNIASNGGGVTFKESPSEAGTKSFTVTATDAAGNTSTQVVTLTIAAGPTTTVSSAKFSNDTGSSSSDFITSNASQTISGSLSAAITAGQSVWVSLDNGVNWVQATTTVNQSTWSLSNQTLKSDSNTLMVQVRDSLGNKGTTYSQAYTLDTTAPSALSVGLAQDTGSSTPDGYTFNPQVNISGKETGATWQYSTNSGKSWTNGSDTVNSFNLAEGSYLSTPDTSVLVRQVDKAGNVSDPTNLGGVVIDTTAPTLTSAVTNTDGDQIILTYNEDLLSTNPAAPTDFTVTVRDVDDNVVAQTVSSVASSGNTVTLNLSSAITNGQTVTVAYADPKAGDDRNAVQDFSGNDAASSLAPTAVTNNSTISSGPSLASVQNLDNVNNLDVRSALVIAFDSAISLNSGKIKIFDDMGNSGWTHTNQSTVNSVKPELTQSIQDTSDNDIVITLANGVVTTITIGGIDRTSRFDLAKSVTVNGNNLVIDLTQKIASGPGYSEGITSFDKSTSNLEHTAFDWDFGSNYHVEFDAGIVKNTSNKMNAALSDSTTLNFTTVTPSTSTTATASQIMDSTGASTTLSAGKSWVSGNQSQVTALTPLVIDMNQGKTNPDDITNRVGVAVVVDSKGQNTRGTNLAGNVQLDNFGSKDLIYMDNHGDMDMITTDGLQSSQPATWSNTTRTLSNPSGNNSILSVYTDAGITGIGVNGDQYLDTKYGQNVVTFG